jgi:hypothetical protein
MTQMVPILVPSFQLDSHLFESETRTDNRNTANSLELISEVGPSVGSGFFSSLWSIFTCMGRPTLAPAPQQRDLNIPFEQIQYLRWLGTCGCKCAVLFFLCETLHARFMRHSVIVVC